MNRELPSTAKGVATEEAVYAAAVDLFATRGYHGTTLRQIAQAVDKQMATLYYYYESKQALLQMIMRTAMSDLANGLDERLQEVGEVSSVEKLREAIRFHVGFHGERAKEAFVSDSEIRAVDERFLPEVLQIRRRYQDAFEGVVREGVQMGEFSVADTTIATIGILQLCTGVAIWYRPGGRMTLSEIADVYAEMVIDGLRGGRD